MRPDVSAEEVQRDRQMNPLCEVYAIRNHCKVTCPVYDSSPFVVEGDGEYRIDADSHWIQPVSAPFAWRFEEQYLL